MHSVQEQGTASISRLLWKYSLPAVAGFFAMALYQFVDRVLVGRGVGTDGMAAVTCAYPLSIVALGIGLLLGTGTGNKISMLLGQGNRDEAERVLGQSLRLSALMATALTVLFVVFARPILRLCGADGVVLDLAVPFLRAIAVGQLFLIPIIAMGNILRIQGRPGLGLLYMVGGTVLNAILATVAIFALHWGVTGAGVATALSQALNFVGLIAFVQSPASSLHVRRIYLGRNAPLARSILSLGAPIFFMQILGTLVFLAANHGAARLDGARGVAVVGVFNTISVLLIYPSLGVVQAMQPLVAYNRGAGRIDRVRELVLRSLTATSLMGLIAAAIVVLFPSSLAALFNRSDVRLVELVSQGLPWFMVSVLLFSVQGTASHYFLAVHQPQKAGALLLGRQLLAIPLFIVLPRVAGFQGLYLVAGLSDLPMAVLAAVLLRAEWRRLDALEPAESAAVAEVAPPVEAL